VSAALTSAIAAAVWTYLPNDDPKSVMDRVRDRGEAIAGLTPDFCLEGYCPADVRRVSLCEAAVSACQASSASCTFTGSCPSTTAESEVSFFGHIFDATPSPQLEPFLTIESPCGGEIWSSTTAAPLAPCPSKQLLTHYSAPWIQSSPGTSTCPVCGIGQQQNFTSGAPVLYLGIDEDAVGLSSPTLYVRFHDGTEAFFALEIPPEQLVAGASLQISNLPFLLSTVDQAAIEFVVDGQYSSSDELLIMYDTEL
jgi:hypothetical protein